MKGKQIIRPTIAEPPSPTIAIVTKGLSREDAEFIFFDPKAYKGTPRGRKNG